MSNLPAKSQSRGIQKRHTRKIKTRDGVREVLVNPTVKKKLRPNENRGVSSSSRKSTFLRPKEPAGLPAPQKELPKVQLRPKRSFIKNEDDLWNELRKDQEWMGQNLGGVNNNIPLLKEILFQMWESQLGDGGTEDERINAFKKKFEFWEVEDWFGNGYGMRFTKWGDWKGEKTLDQIIDEEGQYSVFEDPFEGQLFKKNLEQSLDWDDDKWYMVELQGAGGFAEELMYDPKSIGRDELAIPDSNTMNALRREGVPFIHLAHTQAYRNPDGDMIFIPKDKAGLAKKVLEGLKEGSE
jgi:hypothetical protein